MPKREREKRKLKSRRGGEQIQVSADRGYMENKGGGSVKRMKTKQEQRRNGQQTKCLARSR